MSDAAARVEVEPRERVSRLLEDFCRGPGQRAVWFSEVAAESQPIAAHADRIMPAASLVKLFVVETLLLQIGPQRIDDDAVRVAGLSQTIYPTILAAKSQNDSLTWRELCALTLITSDNSTAAFALEQAGLEAVNSRLASHGLSHTILGASFQDELLGAKGRANVSTAREMGLALRSVWLQRRDFPYGLMVNWLRNNLRNERLPARLPDEVGVAHKTGSLEGVVNDVGIVITEPPYALSVFMDEQEDRAHAAIAISELSESVYGVMARR